MTKLRGLAFTLTLTCVLGTSACKKPEPDIPTFDPMDKILQAEGWKVSPSIVVSPGEKKPTPHHVQAITSGLHEVDFSTPPRGLISVDPSCKVENPDVGSEKYLILGHGEASFPLMENAHIPNLMTFDDDAVSKLAKAQAANMKRHGTRTSKSTSKIRGPNSVMEMKDIFITETSKTVHVALAGGGLYNFNMAPGVRLSGVVVYTNTGSAAVAGVPDHVPVNFVSETHKATRGCWTSIQTRPDESWSKHLHENGRAEARQTHWKRFENRVRKDIGTVPPENVVSVDFAGHYLIGPAPARYEDRLPYVAYARKSIRYMAADHAYFGLRQYSEDYAKRVLDQHYEAHLAGGKK